MLINETGLGNQATLAKIDKLRELNVGAIIPLPQLVVVGDQSSGKSSVLESVTGFSFPRAPGLCTRHATQITCCRDPVEAVLISIIPHSDADETVKAKLLQFTRHLSNIDNNELSNVFKEANAAMGIRTSTADEDAGQGPGAFSQDILKIEIRGPEQEHLTVIDVPGIFRVPTPGLTTQSDIVLVENMVKSYMANPRTIILAVIPCTVDSATQEILKLAEVADPEGVRTMGVLTKPDLATEAATQEAVVSLVAGKGSTLKLGYFLVKNRSADDKTSTLSERTSAEHAFFLAHIWSPIADRCGTPALKSRIRELLMHLSKQELPHVKSEIEQRLRKQRSQLEAIGLPRCDPSSQRLFLGRLSTRFLAVTQTALNGHYSGDKIFKRIPDLKLITKIMKLNEVFSDVFWKRGHKQHFGPTWDDEGESSFGRSTDSVSFEIPLRKYPELEDIILQDDYSCPRPSKGPIIDHIEEVFEENRGPELGTFGGTILATVFEEQSEKWEPLVLSHTSNVIAVIHDYIFRLLSELCPERQIRDQLWNAVLVDRLTDAYRKAMAHARFLLAVERGGTPSTYNHYFNANLQKKRGERSVETYKDVSISGARWADESGERYVPLSKIGRHATDKDNGQQVCEDILDALMSFYKVSRKRFVDVICQQVVFYYLLEGEGNPLEALGPDLVLSFNDEQLEQIAGEDAESKHQRQMLGRQTESLEAALKVLRS